MLRVLAVATYSSCPTETQTTVELSDGRRFTIINNSGCRNIEGTPDRSDTLFWSEWNRYIDCLFDVAEPTEEEIHAYKFYDMPELVGLAEVSEILGISKQAINTYMQRGKFPDPIQRLASGPIWIREQIEDYKKQRAVE